MDGEGRLARTRRPENNDQEWVRLSRRRGVHSTRTPRDSAAKPKECQGENEDNQYEQAEDFHPLTRAIARVPCGVMLAGIGVRLWSRLAGVHSPILRAGVGADAG